MILFFAPELSSYAPRGPARRTGHAAIYVGDGEMVSVTASGVRLDRIDYWTEYQGDFLGAALPPEGWAGIDLADPPVPGPGDPVCDVGGWPQLSAASQPQPTRCPDYENFNQRIWAPYTLPRAEPQDIHLLHGVPVIAPDDLIRPITEMLTALVPDQTAFDLVNLGIKRIEVVAANDGTGAFKPVIWFRTRNSFSLPQVPVEEIRRVNPGDQAPIGPQLAALDLLKAAEQDRRFSAIPLRYCARDATALPGYVEPPNQENLPSLALRYGSFLRFHPAVLSVATAAAASVVEAGDRSVGPIDAVRNPQPIPTTP
jgi:hypothetical protein